MKSFFLFLCFTLLLGACKKVNDGNPEPPQPPEPKLATVVTYPYSDLTRYSVKITGAVTDSGDSKVVEAGFVVDTVTAPTLDRKLNKFVRIPDSAGKMLVIITDIPAGKTYYLRAYAKNNQGISYGNEIKFAAFPEKLYRGNVTLSTQQEVVAFGSNQYTRIDGTLEITGTVTDLSPLKNLASINYAFNVRYTTLLTSLKGLDSLEATNDAGFFHGMRFEGNRALKSLAGLDKLYINYGYLYILNNDELTDLTGLDNLIYSYFGELRIDGCDKIRSLHGLEKLAWVDGDIMIKDNPLLTDISAFKNLAFLSRRIRVINNASLLHLQGFEKLKKIEGLEVYDSPALLDLDGLQNMDTITDIILLRNNLSLNTLSHLQKITTTEFITIENNPALKDLMGLHNLTTVKYKLTVNNMAVENLHGLEKLTTAQGIELFSNSKLKNLQGLNNLTSLAGNAYSLSIARNNQLTSLAGLEKLNKADGSIQIFYNPLLTDFCALKRLFNTGWNNFYYSEGNGLNPTKSDVLSKCP